MFSATRLGANPGQEKTGPEAHEDENTVPFYRQYCWQCVPRQPPCWEGRRVANKTRTQSPTLTLHYDGNRSETPAY